MWRMNRRIGAVAFVVAFTVCSTTSVSGQSEPTPAAAPPAEVAYQEGATYALGQPVRLSEGGGLLVVARYSAPQSGPALVAIDLRILGEADFLGFTYGQAESAITLVAGTQRLPAARIGFADLVVAHFSQQTLVTHMTTNSPNGTLVLDTTERPLVVFFNVPEELAGEPMQLDLRSLTVGSTSYALKINLQE